MHDIHMNQGNDRSHAGDDGVFQDGCLTFEYPGPKYRAFFMAFQSQRFETDSKTGHAIGTGAPAAPAAQKPPKRKKTKNAKTQARIGSNDSHGIDKTSRPHAERGEQTGLY